MIYLLNISLVKNIFLKDLVESYFDVKGWNKKVSKVIITAESLMLPSKKEHKTMYGDIVATLDTGEILSIEMYSRFGLREYKKSASYITKLYSDQLKKNDDYYNAKKVIGLSFMTGNYHRDCYEIINEYGFNKKRTIETIYEDEVLMLDLIRVDLVNVELYTYTKKRFFKWLKLINAKSIEEMKNIANGDEIMEKTVKYLQEFVNDPEILEIYSHDRLNQLNAYDDGVAQGRTEGIEQEKINTAKNLLNIGLNTNVISQATGLTKEQIEDLK